MATSLVDRRTHLAPERRHLAPVCRLVVRLLESGAVTPAPPGGQVEGLVAWCRANKLPLLALPEELPPWLREDPTFVQALQAERAWYETQRGEYLTVREAWEGRDIPCLMIKSAGNPPSFPHLSDNIDILVPRESGRAARDALRGLGYVEVRNVEEPQKFLFRRFHDGRCVSAIHVHERIAWFVEFVDDQAVWRRARPAADDPAVLIPSPEDAILINLAHACYENKLLRFNDVARVRHALQAAGARFDWNYLERIAILRGWLDGLAFMLLVQAEAERALWGETLIPSDRLARFEGIVQRDGAARERLSAIRAAGVADLPLDLSYRFCKRLYYRKILADTRRTATERWRDVVATLVWGIRLKSGIRPQPGLVVSLSGADGSGKTAHAEALVDALRLCEIRADYVWSRGGSTGLLGRLSRLRRRLRPEPAPLGGAEDALTRRRRRLANPVARFAWAWLVALDQVGTALWRVRLPALRGRVVVADRYVYDTAVEMLASLPEGARWSRLAVSAMLRAVRRPDVGYVLDVAPETARARKPEEVWHAADAEERQLYRALAERHGLRLLANDGPFAASNDLLIREVVMTFMARYETRLNALFYANPSQKNVPDPFWAKGGAS